MAITSSSKKYDSPPIAEVACGVHFDEIPELDPVMIGRFWTAISEQFPQRELRPAVEEASSAGEEIVVNFLPRLRALLVSHDGATLLQVQHNRFYFNWRRGSTNAPYPRFSDHQGNPGVGSIAIGEFQRFAEFCKSTLGIEPKVSSVELAKVDLLVEGKHWSGFEDLTLVLPWLVSYRAFSKVENPMFALRFEEQRATGPLAVGIGIASSKAVPPGKRVVKIEARLTATVADIADLPQAFSRINGELNEVFEDLIPEAERVKRFMQGGKHA